MSPKFASVITKYNEILHELRGCSDRNKLSLYRDSVALFSLIELNFRGEFIKLLHKSGVAEKLIDLCNQVREKKSIISSYNITPTINCITIIFKDGSRVNYKLANVSELLLNEFKVSKEEPYFYLLATYLNKDSNYKLIQLYHCLKT